MDLDHMQAEVKRMGCRIKRVRDIRLKALYVIEHICCLSDNEALGSIYKFAHVARGSCQNPHTDWKEELDEAFESLKKSGEEGNE